jgi:ABC-2 type transport system ATP-binding protein
MADLAVEVRELRKSYGNLAAVDGTSFQIAKGEVFAFLGPNGAGKTTTVEILEGLRQRSGGDVRVLGLDPWRDGALLHRRIGVIPQEFRFFEKATPKEAIEYYAVLFGVKIDAKELLERVVLSDKADAHFDTLSGGQKQKLGLALALVNHPDICFLDEPTTGLDPQARRAIWEVIRTLKREGRTVFLTTHYLEEAQLLADRVAIINHGKIIAEGTPEAIIERYGAAPRLLIEGPASLAPILQRELARPVSVHDGQLEVEMRDKSEALKVLTVVQSSGLPWQGFATRRDTLEDIFVRLVGRMDEGKLKTEVAP